MRVGRREGAHVAMASACASSGATVFWKNRNSAGKRLGPPAGESATTAITLLISPTSDATGECVSRSTTLAISRAATSSSDATCLCVSTRGNRGVQSGWVGVRVREKRTCSRWRRRRSQGVESKGARWRILRDDARSQHSEAAAPPPLGASARGAAGSARIAATHTHTTREYTRAETTCRKAGVGPDAGAGA
jgi:hypothetical protein